MNAGAYGSEIKDVLVSSKYMDLDGNIHEINNLAHNFSYRKSFFSDKDYIILSVKLKLTKGNMEEIKQKVKELSAKRIQNQPLNYPSAGSTFKRPEGYFAAALIEEANLKGHQIGGAQVSILHSGFIINFDKATAKDILNLINYVKKVVYEKFNVKLEEEVMIVGEE